MGTLLTKEEVKGGGMGTGVDNEKWSHRTFCGQSSLFQTGNIFHSFHDPQAEVYKLLSRVGIQRVLQTLLSISS